MTQTGPMVLSTVPTEGRLRREGTLTPRVRYEIGEPVGKDEATEAILLRWEHPREAVIPTKIASLQQDYVTDKFDRITKQTVSFW